MAEPKSLLDRIGDALKGDAEEKKETIGKAAEKAVEAAKTMPAQVEKQVATQAEEAKKAVSEAADAAKQQATELRSKLADRDHELTHAKWELNKKERELAEKDKEIATLQETLKAAQNEVAQLREQALAVASRSVAATAAAGRTYIVKPGDSLSAIAKAVYGNAARWPEIFEANKSLIKDPKLIRPGQELQIP